MILEFLVFLLEDTCYWNSYLGIAFWVGWWKLIKEGYRSGKEVLLLNRIGFRLLLICSSFYQLSLTSNEFRTSEYHYEAPSCTSLLKLIAQPTDGYATWHSNIANLTFPGITWRHGSRKNQFGFEICKRPVLWIPGSLTVCLLLVLSLFRSTPSLLQAPWHRYNLQESTIGAAFFTQVLSLNEGTIKFDIWDTAGQERYHSLAPMYYRGAAAAVVVYDITSMVCYLSNYYSLVAFQCRCSYMIPFAIINWFLNCDLLLPPSHNTCPVLNVPENMSILTSRRIKAHRFPFFVLALLKWSICTCYILLLLQ